MNPNDVIEIPLEDLTRDPVLPPRIVDEERLGALCRSMAESGMAEPLVVRRAPGATPTGPAFYIILGYRRHRGATRLSWDTVRAVVREDLDDQGVLQLAFDADKTTESRTALEDCWFYASMCAAGMTQVALARREEFSEAKASMYVRTGGAITPARIAEAGLVPEDLAGFGITRLFTIAEGPDDELAARIAAAVEPPSTEGKELEPSFVWKEGKKGGALASLRTVDVEAWSREDRLHFIDCFGPLVAKVRSQEGLDDPVVAEVRSRLEEAHRLTIIQVREDRIGQEMRLRQMNTELLLALNSRREGQSYPVHTPEKRGLPLLRRLRVPFQQTLRWLRGASTVEGGASMVEHARREGDAQIRIRFDGEQAA
jgi:ParB/RepB/Spo0J family partition protein